jgi:hypothetical protein
MPSGEVQQNESDLIVTYLVTPNKELKNSHIVQLQSEMQHTVNDLVFGVIYLVNYYYYYYYFTSHVILIFHKNIGLNHGNTTPMVKPCVHCFLWHIHNSMLVMVAGGGLQLGA